MIPKLVWPMALAIVLLPLLAGAQEPRSFETAEGLPLTVELRLQRIGADGSSQPVSADYRFADGDLFAIELKASRGGYVRLAVEDLDGENGLRQLWPARGAGHPVQAGRPDRLPEAGEKPFLLTGEGPTSIVVVFSTRPPSSEGGRTWLRQIDLRGEVGVSEEPPAGPKPIHFEGRVLEGGSVKMKISLNHGGGRG
jgi:hypothetical protein